MTLAIVITLISALLIGLGIVGIVYPILPGSFAVLGGTLLWGLTMRGPERCRVDVHLGGNVGADHARA